MKYALGAKRNPTRELPHYEVSAIPLPPKVYTDISHVPVLDQGQQPACVGHAMAEAIMYDYWKKTGKVPSISPRFIYSQAKLLDGDPTGEGTSAYFAFQGVKKAGGAPTTQTVPNDVTLAITDYQTVVITDSITKECKEYPIKAEVEIQNPTDAQLQSLIAQYGIVMVAGTVDENSWMNEDGKVTLLPGNAGGHEFLLFAYDATVPGTWYAVRNSWNTSWGSGGNGSLLYSNYQGNLYDAMVITIDMNNPISNTATLTRGKDDGKETLGTLTVKANGATFTCDTLELPWLNNQHNISCIPKGPYQVEYTYSPLHKKYTYQIMNVPNRDGIRLDVANYASQLLGCVALGNALKDINGDGELDVINSTLTNNSLIGFLNKQPFTLTIQ